MHRRDYFTSPFSSLDFWVVVYACGGDKCDSILALSFSRRQVYNCWWIGQQIGLIYVTFFLESLPKKCQKVPFSNTYTEETQIEFSLFKRTQRSGSEVWQSELYCNSGLLFDFPFFQRTTCTIWPSSTSWASSQPNDL